MGIAGFLASTGSIFYLEASQQPGLAWKGSPGTLGRPGTVCCGRSPHIRHSPAPDSAAIERFRSGLVRAAVSRSSCRHGWASGDMDTEGSSTFTCSKNIAQAVIVPPDVGRICYPPPGCRVTNPTYSVTTIKCSAAKCTMLLTITHFRVICEIRGRLFPAFWVVRPRIEIGSNAPPVILFLGDFPSWHHCAILYVWVRCERYGRSVDD